MGFRFVKSLNTSDNYPITQSLPSTANEDYLLNEALTTNNGALTKCGQTTKPSYIAAEPYEAPAEDNKDIGANAVVSENVYQTQSVGDLAIMPLFSKLILDDSATKVMAQAGTPQKHTATVVATVTTGGNAKVVVTHEQLEEDRTVLFEVAETDDANAVAGKARAALEADDVIKAKFYVSGANATIVLTPIVYVADDATFNIAVDNAGGEGTSVGITTAASSASTAGTANGVATLIKKLDNGECLVRFV